MITTFTIEGNALVAGAARGAALVSAEPLSFWGGYDATTGTIIDRRHPLSGEVAQGRVLVVPFSRGSSTTTAVLLEAIRAGTAPAAIVTTGRDTFFALASIVATELYARAVPVIVVDPDDFTRIEAGDDVEVSATGRLTVTRPAVEEAGPAPRDVA